MNNSFELGEEEKEFFNECYPALFNRNVNILKFIFQKITTEKKLSNDLFLYFCDIFEALLYRIENFFMKEIYRISKEHKEKIFYANQEITNLKLKNLQLELENKRLINELSKQKSKANRNRWWRWLW